MVLASSNEEWSRAAMWYGILLEYTGLPIDALSIYGAILERVPGHPEAGQRASYLSERIKNPLLKD